MNETSLPEFVAYKVGICNASICTSLPIEEALERLNEQHLTGIASQWVLSEDEHFATGQTNPCPCNENPDTHKHYLCGC